MHLFKKKSRETENKQHYREILYGEEHQGPPSLQSMPCPSPSLWLNHVIYLHEQVLANVTQSEAWKELA